jgi:hypothetical protein
VPTVDPSDERYPSKPEHERDDESADDVRHDLQAKQACDDSCDHPCNRGNRAYLPLRRLTCWGHRATRSAGRSQLVCHAVSLSRSRRAPSVSIDQSGEESGEGGLSETPSVASQLVIAAAASAL